MGKIEDVLVLITKGIRVGGKEIRFGASPQDVISDLGLPEDTRDKETDLMQIYDSSPKSPSINPNFGAAKSPTTMMTEGAAASHPHCANDYYYFYNQRGLSF